MTYRSRDSVRHELALLQEELRALDSDIAGARSSLARSRDARVGLGHEAPVRHAAHGEPVELPRGARILIRPLEPEDAGELSRGLKRLSAVSAFKRFRAHVADATPEELDALTRIDHVRHEALAALDPELGDVVGVVRYVCDPAHPEQAEITAVVADDWQRRGVGSELLARLAARARAAGVQRFIFTTLAADEHARRFITRVCDPLDERDHDGIVETVARLRAR
jgi:GNAT superfamily N-acetyltransferase